MQWLDANQAAGCSHNLLACYFQQGPQNNWLITQYINISNAAVTDINVNATFVTSVLDCGSGCVQTIPIRIYQTNRVDEEGRMTTGNYGNPLARLLHTTGAGQRRESDSNVISITSGITGLYLALTDEGTCVEVSRLVVSYTVCPAQMLNLVTYPETIAPTFNNVRPKMVNGSCMDHASLVRGSLTLECNIGGLWGSVDAVCQCDASFEFSISGNKTSCQGKIEYSCCSADPFIIVLCTIMNG